MEPRYRAEGYMLRHRGGRGCVDLLLRPRRRDPYGSDDAGRRR